MIYFWTVIHQPKSELIESRYYNLNLREKNILLPFLLEENCLEALRWNLLAEMEKASFPAFLSLNDCYLFRFSFHPMDLAALLIWNRPRPDMVWVRREESWPLSRISSPFGMVAPRRNSQPFIFSTILRHFATTGDRMCVNLGSSPEKNLSIPFIWESEDQFHETNQNYLRDALKLELKNKPDWLSQGQSPYYVRFSFENLQVLSILNAQRVSGILPWVSFNILSSEKIL